MDQVKFAENRRLCSTNFTWAILEYLDSNVNAPKRILYFRTINYNKRVFRLNTFFSMPKSNNTRRTTIKQNLLYVMFQPCLAERFSFLKTNKKRIEAHSTDRSASCGSIYNLQIKVFSTDQNIELFDDRRYTFI